MTKLDSVVCGHQKVMFFLACAEDSPGLPLSPVRVDDTVQILLDDKALDRMTAWHDRPLINHRENTIIIVFYI